jgi:nicotinate-nucleotide adenylyltransferase
MPAFNTARADEYLKVLEERLPAKTWRHVNSVAEYMQTFAREAGITEEQAVAAGLLHDLCKPMKRDELIAVAREYGIPIAGPFLEYPGLLHGPVAAEECRRSFGIDDDVYQAIYWHTTGRPNWPAVGCALYLADFSEPLRTRPEAAETRGILARDGFGPALRHAVRAKLARVEKQLTVDPVSLAFQKWVEREYA